MELAGGRCDGRVHIPTVTYEYTVGGTRHWQVQVYNLQCHFTARLHLPWSHGPAPPEAQSPFPPLSNQPGTGQETTSWSPKICPEVTLRAIVGGRIHSIHLSSPAMPGPLQHSALEHGSSQWAIAASFFARPPQVIPSYCQLFHRSF